MEHDNHKTRNEIFERSPSLTYGDVVEESTTVRSPDLESTMRAGNVENSTCVYMNKLGPGVLDEGLVGVRVLRFLELGGFPVVVVVQNSLAHALEDLVCT